MFAHSLPQSFFLLQNLFDELQCDFIWSPSHIQMNFINSDMLFHMSGNKNMRLNSIKRTEYNG